MGRAARSREHGPILAICVYHQPDHLWQIPLFIRSLSDQYRFFLRPHNEEGWGPRLLRGAGEPVEIGGSRQTKP